MSPWGLGRLCLAGFLRCKPGDLSGSGGPVVKSCSLYGSFGVGGVQFVCSWVYVPDASCVGRVFSLVVLLVASFCGAVEFTCACRFCRVLLFPGMCSAFSTRGCVGISQGNRGTCLMRGGGINTWSHSSRFCGPRPACTT